MNEYRELVNRFNREVKRLQKACDHQTLTPPSVWYRGDFPTQEPKYCTRCGKMVASGIEQQRRMYIDINGLIVIGDPKE